MKISLDFEFEYDVANADQVTRLEDAIRDAAFTLKYGSPDVRLTKVTHRLAGFYPELHTETEGQGNARVR